MPDTVETRLARFDERLRTVYRLVEGLEQDLRDEREDLRELVRAGDEVIFERLRFVTQALEDLDGAMTRAADRAKKEREDRTKNRTTIAVAVIGGSVTIIAAIVAAAAAIISAGGHP